MLALSSDGQSGSELEVIEGMTVKVRGSVLGKLMEHNEEIIFNCGTSLSAKSFF